MLRRGIPAFVWVLLCTALPAAAGPDAAAVAARVGGEPILLGEVLQTAGSLALLGYADAGDRPGTKERLLEHLITSRLLYLDGRDRHLDQTPAYQEDLRAYTDPILAARYLDDLRSQEQVSEKELLARAAAESTDRTATLSAAERRHLTDSILDERMSATRQAAVGRLRRTTTVTILQDAAAPPPEPMMPVARVGNEVMRWRRVVALTPEVEGTVNERVERAVAIHLLAGAARRRGLDKNAGLEQMVEGFRRGELIKLVREEVIAREGLDDAGVEREYNTHIANFTLPEQRRVQQIVVHTRAEAEEIRAILAAPPPGVTFYTLARDHSIVPGAQQNLGVIGWVTPTTGHPLLTQTAFALAPGEISAPVETDAGFHIIRVLDRQAADVAALDAATKDRIRARWNANRIQAYAQQLAAEKYKVELFPSVYQSQGVAASPKERS